MEGRRWTVMGAISAILGGIAWAIVPTVDSGVTGLLDFAWIPALLLLGAVAGLPAALPALRNSNGRTGLGLVGGGLAFVVVGAGVRLLALNMPPPSLGVAIALGLSGLGLLVTAVGSALVGVVLFRTRTIPAPIAIGFAVALPLDPLVNAVLTPHVGVGISVYGIAWVLLGLAVSRAAIEE